MMTRQEHQLLLEQLKDPKMTASARSEVDARLWEEVMSPEAVPFLQQEMSLLPQVFPMLANHPLRTWETMPKETLKALHWELMVYAYHARTLEVLESVEEVDPQETRARLMEMSLRYPWSDPFVPEELDPLLLRQNLMQRLMDCKAEHRWEEARKIEEDLQMRETQIAQEEAEIAPDH